MGLTSQYEALRYYLRDPDGTIWSDSDLLVHWNDAQQEFARKTGLLTTIAVLPYPQLYTISYIYPWEIDHVTGDIHQALIEWMAGDRVVCYPWETEYTVTDGVDSYARWTHPWESEISGESDPVPMLLPEGFLYSKFAAYDHDEIRLTTQWELARDDRFFLSRSGQADRYYRPDESSSTFFLYPRPAETTFQDPNYTDVLGDTGGIDLYDETYYSGDTGLPSEPADTEDAVFFVYERQPTDIDSWQDSLPMFPSWAWDWIVYGTLERAYSADTDGFIPSLRDFWRSKKEIAIEMAKRICRIRSAQNIVYINERGPSRNARRSTGGSLPSGYPAT